MSLRLVLLGPPGAGKGTLAGILEKELGLAHVSTGEIFRDEIRRKTSLGKTVNRFVTSGRLVPDELVVSVMAGQLARRRKGRGLALDGFPRTVGQAKGLEAFLSDRGLALDGAIYLDCPTPLLIARLSGRRVCSRCGSNYHIRTMRPRRSGVCDACGGTLIVRKDDQVNTITKRLVIDRAQATPLLDFYRQHHRLYRVSGSGGAVRVFQRVQRLMQQRGWLKK
ncbi:MAG: nucleoside monophosphate kinase [Candidatus Omnitrophica bacterium]|nr:nucleoside monophosphate kinase [Candidatus Omnitrophota bacterium]